MVLESIRALASQMQVMDQVHDSIVVTTLDGIIASWNRGAERLHGYRAEEVLGLPVTIVYAPEELGAIAARRIGSIMETGFHEFDAMAITKLGRRHAVHVRLSLLRDSEGTPVGIVSFALETSELEQARADLQERERQLRTILDAMPLCVAHVSADQRFLFVNRAIEELVGRPSNEIVGTSIRIDDDATFAAREPSVRAVLAGRETTTEDLVSLPNGEKRTMSLHRVPDIGRDGQVRGFYVVGTDVTARKKADEQRLEQERKLRETLVAEVHHRVKNSLQGIVGLLRTQVSHRTELAPVLEPVISQVLAIAISFGLMSRRGSSGFVLCELTRELAYHLSQMADVDIDVRWDEATTQRPIEIDQAHAVNLSLVLNELMFNAVKHSSAAGPKRRITVTISRVGDAVTLRISSASQSLPEGFRFQAGQGLGLGLSLVRLLLPSKGCRLSFESSADGVAAVLEAEASVLGPAKLR